MSKITRRLLIAIVSLVAILLSINVYNRIKIQNVFDEIYYDSKNASGDGFERRSSLGNIKGMSSSAANLTGMDDPNGKMIIVETYKTEDLTPPIESLSIMNDSVNKVLNIGYSYKVTPNVTAFLENNYDVKTRKLTKKLSFVEVDSDKRITTKKEVTNMISKYNITNQQLTAWEELGMNKTFLKDWISVYRSKYSVERLGNVDIVNNW